MKPNPEKYQAMVLGRTEEQLLLKLGNNDIRTTEKTNLLGVVLDSKLKFDDHVSSICHKVSAQINALNRLKNILPLKTKESIRLPSMESRRIQDMLLTIHNSISNKAPWAIRKLINLRPFKYNLRHQEYVLSLPKVNTTKYGLKSWRYFAAQKWNELSNDIRIKVGTNEIVNRIRSLNFGD
ncbi:uncharacterized protein LOC110048399 [Orbicella faveolata]|uniref:uncharacterized protein LOC110048399 n=1 Tax=Orbicella faveolata TaxID=48498 RepID=UPI0009E27085|nr:uncharacterized protein LOC110048399 [Orbicella faveolata]